jgi:MPBQ/MSBQ methyltransferase
MGPSKRFTMSPRPPSRSSGADECLLGAAAARRGKCELCGSRFSNALTGHSQSGVEQNIYRTAARMGVAVHDRIRKRLEWEYSGRWLSPAINPLSKAKRSLHLAQPATRRGLEKRTATLVNEWYDKRMYTDGARKRYGASDFHNFGFWTVDTQTQRQACENLMEMLLAFIPSKTGTILDVACGKGATTRHLLNYYKPRDVTGINISEKQLSTCRLNAPECNFLAMNATNLQFENSSFDNVICVEAAFHFVTRARFVQEARRVLKPGGRLVLSDLLPAKPRHNPRPVAPTERVISPEGYRDLYFEAGFEKLEIVDATKECTIGFKQHSLRLHQDKWRRAETSWPTYQRRRARIKEKILNAGYYLLVCAQKRLAE